jgi:hypothetical protein
MKTDFVLMNEGQKNHELAGGWTKFESGVKRRHQPKQEVVSKLSKVELQVAEVLEWQ